MLEDLITRKRPDQNLTLGESIILQINCIKEEEKLLLVSDGKFASWQCFVSSEIEDQFHVFAQNKAIVEVTGGYLRRGYHLIITKFTVLINSAPGYVCTSGVNELAVLQQEFYETVLRRKGMFSGGELDSLHPEFYLSPVRTIPILPPPSNSSSNSQLCKDCNKYFKTTRSLKCHWTKTHKNKLIN